MDASHKGEVLAGISISERDRALVAQHLSVAGATTVSGKGFHKPREPQQVYACGALNPVFSHRFTAQNYQ
jgi:hypothetical protein